ncbi:MULTISPECIES: DUF928 domain-containing protein [Spirulina sp. CCY15215]|uniref:DUF928 domain-containing protein n=1 Tax=Spirulina sp. CCY15215 TaxID=2767591 RepID=UPI0019504207|nr:DUF928 domain-containing protein [Spirulina major]
MRLSKSHLFQFLALAVGTTLLTGFSGAIAPSGALLAQGIPSQWDNANFTPPAGLGAPERTQSGGTRSGDRNPLGLAALVPASNFGVTVTDSTSVFIYVPAMANTNATRDIYFQLTDASDRLVYEAEYQISGAEGILRIVIPETNEKGENLLAEEQDYSWSVNAYDETNEVVSEVYSSIRRVPLSGEMTAELSGKSSHEQARLLADKSIWYGALNKLAQAYQENPDDAAIAQDWKKLLQAAGLESFSRLSANTFIVPEVATSQTF